MGVAPSAEVKAQEERKKQDQRKEKRNDNEQDEEAITSQEFITRQRSSLDARRSSSSDFGGRFSFESTGSLSQRSSRSSVDNPNHSICFFDSAQNFPTRKLDSLPEEEYTTKIDTHRNSEDSARVLRDKTHRKSVDYHIGEDTDNICQQAKEEEEENTYTDIYQSNPLVSQQIVTLYLQLTNKRVEDLTDQDYLLISQLCNNPQVLTTQIAQTIPQQVQTQVQQPQSNQYLSHQPQALQDPYSSLSAEEQALLDAYQYPSQANTVTETASNYYPTASLSAEEQVLLEAYQYSGPSNTTVFEACDYQQQSSAQQGPHTTDPFSGFSAEDLALLEAYQGERGTSVSLSIQSEPIHLCTSYTQSYSGSMEKAPSRRSNPETGVNPTASSSFFGRSSEQFAPPARKDSASGRSSCARSSFAEEQRVVRPSMDIAGGHYTRFSGVQGTREEEHPSNGRISEAMSLISEASSVVTQPDAANEIFPNQPPPPLVGSSAIDSMRGFGQLPPPPPPPGPPPGLQMGSGAAVEQSHTMGHVLIHDRAERLKAIRSSFAAERKSVEQYEDIKDSNLFDDIADSGNIRITADSLASELLRRYYQLAVVPDEVPVPITLLSMLWGTTTPVTLVDAEATAWIMEDKNIARVVILEEGALWFMVNSDHSNKLKDVMSSQLKDMHSRLINLYRQGFHDLALVPDDNYFMQNIALHLTEAGRLTELSALLRDPIWLETKLRSYGTAPVVSDFRRYFSCREDPDLKLMLRAFQISANGSLDHATLYILKEQMLARLMISAEKIPGIKDWYDQGVSECRMAVPYRKSKSMPVHLLPKTPSLEQAGGLQRLILKGHMGGIQKVELAPNGLEVVTASSDGTIRVWDMEIGDFVLKLESHEGSVSCFALSKDGRTLVSGGEDGVATVYELPSGIWRHKLSGHTKRINAVAIDPFCRRVVTSSQDMTTRIWSLTQGTCLHVLTDVAGAKGATWDDWAAHHGVAISPDSRLVATVDGEFYVRIWMMETATLTDVLEGHSDWVVALSFAGDGGLLLTASHDKTVRLWNLWKGFCEHVFEGHRGRINNLVVTTDGRRAVSVSDDAIGIVWDVSGHSKVCELAGHGSWINDAAITQDGSRIVTVSGDDLAIVWDGDSGKPLRILNGHSGEIKSVCISYKGRFAITGSEDSTARVWDLTAPSTHLEDFHQGKVTRVLHHPGNKHVITIGEDSNALIWDIQTSQCIRIICPKLTTINFAFLVNDGKCLVTSSGDRCLCVWDMDSGECIKRVPSHAGSRVKSIAVSPDGTQAVICLFDSTVSIWNLETMELTNWLMKRAERDGINVHSAAVNEVIITGNGEKAITISKDSTARLWDLNSCTTELILKGHEDGVNLLSVKGDGTACMTAGYDKTARVWDLRSGECLMVLDHPKEIDYLATDPQWKRAVTIAGEKTAWLWDIAKGRCLGILESHGDHLSGVVFSSDSQFLATYSLNSVVRVWTAHSGKLRAVYLSDSGISSCNFAGSPQIDTLVVGDGNGHVHLLEFPAHELSSSTSVKKATGS